MKHELSRMHVNTHAAETDIRHLNEYPKYKYHLYFITTDNKMAYQKSENISHTYIRHGTISPKRFEKDIS